MFSPENEDMLLGMMKKELYTAVIGDIMDSMGFYDQFLPSSLKPLDDGMMVAGRAMPVMEADIGPDAAILPDRPFGLMLEALDDLKRNEVYICTGSSHQYALWGELMSMRAVSLGAAGAVVNGFSRDTKGIIRLGFPTFSCGIYAKDQAPRGKVTAYRVPVIIGGVSIKPGDMIFGDREGVLVIPVRHEKEIIEKSFAKARGEKTVAEAIKAGMSAGKAFETYGIL